jgi:hypothetical protein
LTAVGDFDREIFDVGDVDRRCVLVLNMSGEMTQFPKALVIRERVLERDGDIQVG